MTPHTEQQARTPRLLGATGLWAVLGTAIVLRLWCADATSLWLDDFHSLYHARAATWGEFFAGLRQDNHPPLSFALLRVTRAVLGESELALRAPALLVGLATIGLLYASARRAMSRRTSMVAAFLLAVSSLHLEASVGVRMYALLALAVLGFIEACAQLLEEGRGAWRLALWTFIGLHTHYHFLHAVFVLAGTTLVLVVACERYRVRWRALVLALVGAALASLPWYVYGFREQLSHDLAPGGSDVSVIRLAAGIAHLVFHEIWLHDERLRYVFLAGGVIVVASAAAGAWLLVRRGHASKRPALAALVIAGGFGLPVWTAVAAALSARAGFDWRYLTGAVAPFVTLAALGGMSPELPLVLARRAATAFALAAALGLAVLNAAHDGSEDYRTGTEAILLQARPGDAVLAADRQPSFFPHSIGWDYYSRRFAAERGYSIPPLLEFTNEFVLVAPESLANIDQVHCLLRSIRHSSTMLNTLRDEFAHEESRAYGRGVFVLTFSR